MGTKKGINTLRFRWDSTEQKFQNLTKTSIISINLYNDILKFVESTENTSGISSRFNWLQAILFTLITLGGFVSSFLTIYYGFPVLGGILILSTPFVGFFPTFGWQMTKKGKRERIEEFLAIKQAAFEEELSAYEVKVCYSVFIGKFKWLKEQSIVIQLRGRAYSVQKKATFR